LSAGSGQAGAPQEMSRLVYHATLDAENVRVDVFKQTKDSRPYMKSVQLSSYIYGRVTTISEMYRRNRTGCGDIIVTGLQRGA
jgi:hypothetical protein